MEEVEDLAQCPEHSRPPGMLVPFFLLGNEAPPPHPGKRVRDEESQEPEPGVGQLGSLAYLSVLPDRNNRLAEDAAFRESFCRGRSEGDEEEFLRALIGAVSG